MEDYQKYEKEYSEGSLWNTVKKWSSKLGEEAIPDFIPLAGLTDDIGAIAYLIKSLATYITPEIKQQARERAHRIIH